MGNLTAAIYGYVTETAVVVGTNLLHLNRRWLFAAMAAMATCMSIAEGEETGNKRELPAVHSWSGVILPLDNEMLPEGRIGLSSNRKTVTHPSQKVNRMKSRGHEEYMRHKVIGA